jgi:hypothetical protein
MTAADIATALTSYLTSNEFPPLNSDLARNALLGKLVELQTLALAEAGGGATTTTPAYTEVTTANQTASITAGAKSVAINPESGGTYKVTVGGNAFNDRTGAAKVFTGGMTINAELGTTLPLVLVTWVAGVTQILSTTAA